MDETKPKVTLFTCGPNDKQKGCQHKWVPENNPDHCSECYMDFTYYTFMESM